MAKAKTTFVCPHCAVVMCDDCRTIADEYADLHAARGLALLRAEEELAELKRRCRELENELLSWKEISQIGYPETVRRWQEAEVKKARQAGRASMRRELKKSGLLGNIAALEKASKGK